MQCFSSPESGWTPSTSTVARLLTAGAFTVISGAGPTLAPIIPAGNQDGFGSFGYAENSDGPPNNSQRMRISYSPWLA